MTAKMVQGLQAFRVRQVQVKQHQRKALCLHAGQAVMQVPGLHTLHTWHQALQVGPQGVCHQGMVFDDQDARLNHATPPCPKVYLLSKRATSAHT